MAKRADRQSWARAQSAAKEALERMNERRAMEAEERRAIKNEEKWHMAVAEATERHGKAPPWISAKHIVNAEVLTAPGRVVRMTSDPGKAWSWNENRYGITEVTYDPMGERYFDQLGRQVYQYRDPDGRMYWKPVNESEEDPKLFKDPEKPEGKPVATAHKAGHFPIEWMVEAATRAEESDALVHIEVDPKGVTVIAEQAGEEYASHHIVWRMMEKAHANPLILAIEHVERQLRVQSGLKEKKR